jgi:signal transduction histidine kinase
VVLTGEETDVRIEVVNRGLAIEQSALDQIFDPLKRGSVQHHDTYDSLRLGLYIVREVARENGGEIDVRSDFTAHVLRRLDHIRPTSSISL